MTILFTKLLNSSFHDNPSLRQIAMYGLPPLNGQNFDPSNRLPNKSLCLITNAFRTTPVIAMEI